RGPVDWVQGGVKVNTDAAQPRQKPWTSARITGWTGWNEVDGVDRCLRDFPWRLNGRSVFQRGSGRWCNGSTTPFGGVCPGSNPGRTAMIWIPPGHVGDRPDRFK